MKRTAMGVVFTLQIGNKRLHACIFCRGREECKPMILSLARIMSGPIRQALVYGLPVFIFVSGFNARLHAGPVGPTLRLDYGRGEPIKNATTKFMYFVPLISPEPVSVFTNAGNTHCTRVT